MIKIALLGCGTVAGGVVTLLKNNKHDIEKRLGDEIEIKKLLELDFDKPRKLGITEEQLCSDYNEILNDEEIQIVVELIGGTKIAYEFITKAMQHKKHVVTANKDLIALYWDELNKLAEENGVDFYYEASVGGGIPIILPLKETLAGNKFREIIGVLNGTTNYILTKMAFEGATYGDALSDAQALGYAEANPASDVEGLHTARKIAILSTIAFNSQVKLNEVYCEGITEIDTTDIAVAKELGYVIKLVAVAKETDGEIEAYVRPAFVPKSHPISSVNDVFNAVFLRADAVDDVMLFGRGAGSLPTASSVVGDIMEICRNIKYSSFGRHNGICYENKKVKDIFSTTNKFYVRMLVTDRANVLAGIASEFGEHSISLASLKQNTLSGEHAELVIITHSAKEADLRAALDSLMQKDYIHKINTMICLDGSDVAGQF
jgi:homoserine dehydrogenase